MPALIMVGKMLGRAFKVGTPPVSNNRLTTKDGNFLTTKDGNQLTHKG